ncbi:protein of unknown function [Xenorhabdus poinarii G6]|uniref:Uncharacterized protein n=1 Tax=Xenorhabdus poinarii G6 TaxID=1354304 RepID=A0A068R7Q1_9GAMM|nr:protein of unknown function [Xenorhabdus poinarii G6]
MGLTSGSTGLVLSARYVRPLQPETLPIKQKCTQAFGMQDGLSHGYSLDLTYLVIALKLSQPQITAQIEDGQYIGLTVDSYRYFSGDYRGSYLVSTGFCLFKSL